MNDFVRTIALPATKYVPPKAYYNTACSLSSVAHDFLVYNVPVLTTMTILIVLCEYFNFN